MWKELLNLYWIFVKMGAVCFGGGYAMLPILERELVLKRGWVTKEEIIDYYALGQCTPGVTFFTSRFGGLAQLARAPALQAGGQRFESVILHTREH